MIKENPIAMRDALIEKIWREMKKDKNIFFVSADFGSPVLDKVRQDFPDQFVNVGVAEQNLINISVGLALEGYQVFCYAIAPFIPMRCYEQIRVSIALLSEVRPMNINLIAVGAGVSYAISGPTHQCYEDISLMRALPNFTVLSPSDHISSGHIFDYCRKNISPKYIRLDVKPLEVVYKSEKPNINMGFYIHNSGMDLCFIATGYMLHTAFEVSNKLTEIGIKSTVIDMLNITHFSKKDFLDTIKKFPKIITMEEGFSGRGGLDSMIFDLVANNSIQTSVLNIGVSPNYTFEIGTRSELHHEVGISPEVVFKKVKKFFFRH